MTGRRSGDERLREEQMARDERLREEQMARDERSRSDEALGRRADGEEQGTPMSTVTEYPSATAKARFVRVSASKARRVIDLVRGKSVEEALDILRWAPQAASEPVAKVIASAAANAQNNEGLDPATLVVATVYADEGPTAKRIRPRAQGRAFRIRKRTSHITVIVESRPPKNKGASASSARSRRAQASKAAAAKTTSTEASSEAKGGSQ